MSDGVRRPNVSRPNRADLVTPFAADAGFAGVGLPRLMVHENRSKSSWLRASGAGLRPMMEAGGIEPPSEAAPTERLQA